jgi:hypothetical protein
LTLRFFSGIRKALSQQLRSDLNYSDKIPSIMGCGSAAPGTAYLITFPRPLKKQAGRLLYFSCGLKTGCRTDPVDPVHPVKKPAAAQRC